MIRMIDETEKTRNPKKKPHPWALHGDYGSESMNIISLPAKLREKLEKPDIKTNSENSSHYEDLDLDSVLHDAVALETVLETIDRRRAEIKKEEPLASQDLPRPSLDEIIEDGIAFSLIIDSIQIDSPAKDELVEIRSLMDTDLMQAVCAWPLIFPDKKKEHIAEKEIHHNPEKVKNTGSRSQNNPQMEKISIGGYRQIVPEKTEEDEKTPSSVSEKSDFLKWLNAQNQQKEETKEESKHSTLSPADQKSKDEKKKAKKLKKALKKEKKKEKKRRKKEKKKARKKEKKKKLEELLQSSNEIGDEIASETLAKLLAHQGHTERAIHMYKKLSLLNPKKSSYFAEIIDKLEEK